MINMELYRYMFLHHFIFPLPKFSRITNGKIDCAIFVVTFINVVPSTSVSVVVAGAYRKFEK